MTFAFNAYIGAVSRTVSEVERDGKPARKVTLERSFDTTAADLWDAVTKPERLPRWFLPVSGDLRPGGRYQFKGNAGGTITECVPPRFLAATWEWAGNVSWVEVRVAAAGGGQSRLMLSHICPLDDHWREYGPGAVGIGWDLALIGLALDFSGADVDRSRGPQFAMSPDGKAFIAGAGTDWGRAAVACGESRAQAEDAAKQTIAFYTGESTQGA
jgi:uncharacterized protein YndB with AHSA1/START domain